MICSNSSQGGKKWRQRVNLHENLPNWIGAFSLKPETGCYIQALLVPLGGASLKRISRAESVGPSLASNFLPLWELPA